MRRMFGCSRCALGLGGLLVAGAVWADTMNMSAGDDLVAAFETLDARINSGEIASGTLSLAEGTFEIGKEISVTNAISIVGAGRNKTIVRQTNVTTRVFSMANDGAALADLGVCGAKWSTKKHFSNGLCVNLSKGLIRDCRVFGVTNTASEVVRGLGLYLSGGKVERTIVSDNYSSVANQGGYGGGVYMVSGRLENCLVTRNRTTTSGGGLYATSGGVAVNCSFIGNTSTAGVGGGVYVDNNNPVIVNCLMSGNVAPADACEAAPEAAGKEARYINCAIPAVWGTAPVTSDPLLLTNNHLQAASPCRSAGCWSYTIDKKTYTLDMTSDLDGTVRDGTHAPDLGCYIYDNAAFACGFSANLCTTFVGEPITLTSTVENASDDVTYAWTFTAADGSEMFSSEQNPTVTLTTKGAYDVTLVVTSGSASTACTMPNYLFLAPKKINIALGDSIADAVSEAIDGTEIVLANGTHQLSAELVIDKGIRLVGSGWTNCVVERPATSKSNYRLMQINHPQAEVTGMTLANGRVNDGSALGINIAIGANGGTCSWCRVTGGKSVAYYQRGGGVGMSGANAVLTHCLVDGNDATFKEQTQYGGGIAATAGLIENCLIAGNTANRGGGVYVYGADNAVTIRHCTIVKNTATKESGGIYMDKKPSAVYNSVFALNTATNDGTDGKPEFNANADRFKYCGFVGVSESAVTGVGSFVTDDTFADSAKGDYRPKLSSKFVDRGFDYGSLPEVDLDGHARFVGQAPDVGCYEVDNTAFACGIGVETKENFVDQPFVLNATVNGEESSEVDVMWNVSLDDELKAVGSGMSFTNIYDTVGKYRVELTVTRRADGAMVSEAADEVFYAAARTNWVESAEDVATAYAASIDGATIAFRAGTYALADELIVSKAVRLEGFDRTVTTLTLVPNVKTRVLQLANGDAVAHELTITGGLLDNGEYGAGVYISSAGGTLVDCHVVSNSAAAYYVRGGGVAVCSEKGAVIRCEIDNNDGRWKEQENNEVGGGLYLSAGRAENCLVHHNWSRKGGGVAFAGSATLVNCSVVSNRVEGPKPYVTGPCHGGGLYVASNVKNVQLINCLFAANTDSGASMYDGAPEWHIDSKGAIISTACLWDEKTPQSAELGSDTIYVNPRLRERGAEPYRLSAGSPAIDAGSNEAYGTTLKTDLDVRKKPRLRGRRVDIGAYESGKGFHLIVR